MTYALLHGNFNHLFFNMFAVWMFGTPLERAWGSQRFVFFMTVCVAGAAVVGQVTDGKAGTVRLVTKA